MGLGMPMSAFRADMGMPNIEMNLSTVHGGMMPSHTTRTGGSCQLGCLSRQQRQARHQPAAGTSLCGQQAQVKSA